MQKNSSMAQTIVLAVFGVGIILGVLFFSGKVPLPNYNKKATSLTGSVVVWGVLPYVQVRPIFDAIQNDNEELKLAYSQKSPETVQDDLVNALASGKGPDIFMMNSQQVAENLDRLYIIPYTNYPETTFRKTFTDVGNSLLINKGILALPMLVDPMVLYYNKDIFTSNFEVNPPKTWDELANLVPKFTKKDEAGKINQSTISLGTSNNVSYPKEFIILHMLQEGNPIIHFATEVKKWQSDIQSGNALANALSWYISFTNPASPTYSWNTSLPKDRDMFISGKSAMYIGYPTELETIRKLNPNLNFAMTMIPQISADARKTDYAQVYSLGISKISQNQTGALGVANILTSKDYLTKFINGTYYAPARRDILDDKPKDNDIMVTIYNSAIISKSFFDPNSTQTKNLLVTAINQINAGNRTVEQSLLSIYAGFREITAKLILAEDQAL